MYRILQTAMAEFSYMLEKHLMVTSMLPTAIIIAAAYAAVLAVVFLCVEAVCRKKYTFCFRPAAIAAAWAVSITGDALMRMPQTWDSKIYRVMSNFQYITSFDTNRQIFLSSLALPDSKYNKAHLFEIALKLNDAQWASVAEGTGGSSWYFLKVEKAIREICRIGNCHLSIRVMHQCLAAYISCIILAALGVALFYRKHKIEAILVILVSVTCRWYSLGGAIFLCTMVLTIEGAWWYAQKLRMRNGKRNHPQIFSAY